MDTDNLIRRADANYFHCRSVFATAALRGDVAQWGGILLTSIGVKMAPFNTAFVTQPLTDPVTEVRGVVSFFGDRGLPFSIRIREDVDPAAEDACEELGLVLEQSEPGMVLPEISSDIPSPPPGLEVRRVSLEEGYDDFVVTMSVASGMPVESGYHLISPELFDALWVEHYTGYVDGQAVATSTLVASHRVAGVYNISTLEGHRRKGYGTALSWHAIARGTELRANIASLQATEMGAPLYERMGFRKLSTCNDYVQPVDS